MSTQNMSGKVSLGFRIIDINSSSSDSGYEKVKPEEVIFKEVKNKKIPKDFRLFSIENRGYISINDSVISKKITEKLEIEKRKIKPFFYQIQQRESGVSYRKKKNKFPFLSHYTKKELDGIVQGLNLKMAKIFILGTEISKEKIRVIEFISIPTFPEGINYVNDPESDSLMIKMFFLVKLE